MKRWEQPRRLEYLKRWRKLHPFKQSQYDKRRDKIYRNLWFREARTVRLEFVKALKEIAGCKHCGIRDARVLDFHHRSPKTKKIGISIAVMRVWSLKKIFREVLKCDVLCSNCHRIETSENNQYRKGIRECL